MKIGFYISCLLVATACSRPGFSNSLGARSGSGDYINSEELDVPWGKSSFFKVPWRGYLETVPGDAYLRGLGVAWSVPPSGISDDDFARSLAAAGFRRVRIEIPWSDVKWDETGLTADAVKRYSSILQALRAHDLRPLILLNAHHSQPGPMVPLDELSLPFGANAGDTVLHVAGALTGVAPWQSELADFTNSHSPGPLITAVDSARQTVTLSKPLPANENSGQKLSILHMKYKPLYDVGTVEYSQTLAGWKKYALIVAKFVSLMNGSDDFDIEVWNEVSFGSAFLYVGNYLPSGSRIGNPKDLFRPGGSAWGIGDATVKVLHLSYPGIKVIWGFSNTTFFHTPPVDLPAGTYAQSYHPYGVERRCFPKIAAKHENGVIDGIVPDFCAVQPEGWAHTFQQTESLMRLLQPDARKRAPSGSENFEHFITEHGFSPSQLGIRGAANIDDAKAKFVLRSTLFWINKGISAIYLFNAWTPVADGMGFLGTSGGQTPATLALARVVKHFAGASKLSKVNALTFDVKEVGKSGTIFAARGGAPALRDEDVTALLPFQLSQGNYSVAAYVMTQDFPNPFRPRKFEILIGGVDGKRAIVTGYDPLTGLDSPVDVVRRGFDKILITMTLTDSPRLIDITS